MPAPPLSLLWLVPALPLAGFVLNGALALTRPTAKRAVSIVGVGTLVLAFAAAAFAVAELARQHPTAPLVFRYWEWLPVGDLQVAFALQLDQLAAVMILVVTGVGALIHVFSVGYMYDDPGYARYFAYLNLFVFFMLILVLGASFPVMFVGWEGVGLCSYLLIGFWFNEQVNADAGKKAFIVNRIGDFGFLVAMFLIFTRFGTLDFETVFAKAPAALIPGGALVTAITLFLFLGCTGKSAQIPLYIWLPDAMQGPTPVSALIHAATMVTAGVYLVARCGALFALSPLGSAVVAGIGALTALFAATLAIAGIPPFAGFFSKDEILGAAFAEAAVHPAWYAFWAMGIAAALLTAFYMTRLMLYTFHGPNRTGEREREHLHEAPPVMTGPLVVLGVLTLLGGALNIPSLFGGGARLEHWLAPVTDVAVAPAAEASPATEWALVGSAVLVAVLGLVGALRLLKPETLVPARLAPPERGLGRLLWKKWYVDELYDAIVVRPVMWLSREVLWKVVDVRVVDGLLVNGTAAASRAVGWVGSRLQTGEVGVYVVLFVVGVIAVVGAAVR